MTAIVSCANRKGKYCQRLLSLALRASKLLARYFVHRQNHVQEVISN